MSDYIKREDAIDAVCGWGPNDLTEAIRSDIETIPAADVRPVPAGGIGEMSDGYHTFNGLYYQRMVLFAALVRQNRGRAWKSWKHEGGELCFGGGWFIVGIDTPQGTYTYHYEAKDFDLFDCEELPVAKHWDGHTEKDVTRLLSLDVRPVRRGKWENNHCSACGMMPMGEEIWECCDFAPPKFEWFMNYCPNCGAWMEES